MNKQNKKRRTVKVGGFYITFELDENGQDRFYFYKDNNIIGLSDLIIMSNTPRYYVTNNNKGF